MPTWLITTPFQLCPPFYPALTLVSTSFCLLTPTPSVSASAADESCTCCARNEQAHDPPLPSLLFSLSFSLDGSLSLFLSKIRLACPAETTTSRVVASGHGILCAMNHTPTSTPMKCERKVLNVGICRNFFLSCSTQPSQCQQLTLLIS